MRRGGEHPRFFRKAACVPAAIDCLILQCRRGYRGGGPNLSRATRFEVLLNHTGLGRSEVLCESAIDAESLVAIPHVDRSESDEGVMLIVIGRSRISGEILGLDPALWYIGLILAQIT